MDARSIDVAKTASIDMMSLNNKVVKMRPVIKRSKSQVVNRLCRHIATLKKKKGTEAQKEKNIRKAERLIEEIESIRRLKEDKVSKYSLANTTSFESISKSTLSPNVRALARLADHHLVKEVVNDFRQKHSDWRDLAAFLLVKQTGRKFKTKKQKQKKLAQRVENINASETMTKAYIEERFGKEGLEKAEQRFQKKRRKGKDLKVDTKEANLPEMDTVQDTGACHDREEMQIDDTISPYDGTEGTVSKNENQKEDFTSVEKGLERNVKVELVANVVKSKNETMTSSGSKKALVVNTTSGQETAQDSRSQLGNRGKEGDSEGDDSPNGESEEEKDEYNKEQEEGIEENQAAAESEDIEDSDDGNETEESNVTEDKDDEDNERVDEKRSKKDTSSTVAISKIQSAEESVKKDECVVKKLKIGASSSESDDDDEDDEEEEEADKIREEDSDDTSMEEESNSISSKSVSSEEDEGDIESQQPHKKRKAQKQDKRKKGKLVPEFLTKGDRVLKNTPNDPFFVGSDGEEGEDDGDFMRHSEMDLDAKDDYFDERESGSSKRTSKSMFYEPGAVVMSGQRFEKKDFSTGFKSRGRGRFEYRSHGRSFEKRRGDVRGRGRGGYSYSSHRGREREVTDFGERKAFKFGSGRSRGEKRGGFSSRGSSQTGRGDIQMPSQRFGSSSSKDSGPDPASAEKLHPSWEASRKRKAEQSGLKAFEGTKIVFDED